MIELAAGFSPLNSMVYVRNLERMSVTWEIIFALNSPIRYVSCDLGCLDNEVGFDVEKEIAQQQDPNGIAIRNGTEYLFKSNAYSWKLLNFMNVLATFGTDALFLECMLSQLTRLPSAYVSESFHKWQRQYKDSAPWSSIPEFLARYHLTHNVNVSLAASMSQRRFQPAIIEGLVSRKSRIFGV